MDEKEHLERVGQHVTVARKRANELQDGLREFRQWADAEGVGNDARKLYNGLVLGMARDVMKTAQDELDRLA